MILKKTNLKIFTFLFLLSLALSQACLAGPSQAIINGFSNTGWAAGYPVGGAGVPKIEFVPAWVNYLNAMLFLMGALFMVNIIFAGYLWMTAFGKEEQVTRAKNLMINSTIGLSIIIGARLIVELALIYLKQTVKTA